MMHAVIVEDDPMVAHINEEYLAKSGDFTTDKILGDGRTALSYLKERAVSAPPDLIILDMYMPIMNGITLLQQLRAEHILTPVIMVTAATEASLIEEALGLGIVDYLIKPYKFERFKIAVGKFLERRNVLGGKTKICQESLDILFSSAAGTATAGKESSAPVEIPKGLNLTTLNMLQEFIDAHKGERHSCESISEATGLSKVTIRHYLNYFIETGKASSTVDYETGGRPRVLFFATQ